MTLSASDLPNGVKQQLLEKVRKELGSDEYKRMVGAMGEDGVVDLALQSTAGGSSSAESRSDAAHGPAAKIGNAVVSFCGWVITHSWPIWPCVMYELKSAPGGAKILAGIFTTLVFWIVLGACVREIKEGESQPLGFWGAMLLLYLFAMLICGVVYTIWGIIQIAS